MQRWPQRPLQTRTNYSACLALGGCNLEPAQDLTLSLNHTLAPEEPHARFVTAAQRTVQCCNARCANSRGVLFVASPPEGRPIGRRQRQKKWRRSLCQARREHVDEYTLLEVYDAVILKNTRLTIVCYPLSVSSCRPQVVPQDDSSGWLQQVKRSNCVLHVSCAFRFDPPPLILVSLRIASVFCLSFFFILFLVFSLFLFSLFSLFFSFLFSLFSFLFSLFSFLFSLFSFSLFSFLSFRVSFFLQAQPRKIEGRSSSTPKEQEGKQHRFSCLYCNLLVFGCFVQHFVTFLKFPFCS